MAWKNLKQKSLADSLVVHHQALEELDGVNELIDWSRIEALLVDIHNKRRGEQAWPPLMMFKALLLQSWYHLRASLLIPRFVKIPSINFQNK